MTLNGVMAVIMKYSTEFGSFWANYVKVVKDRPIIYAKNVLERIYFVEIYDLWRQS